MIITKYLNSHLKDNQYLPESKLKEITLLNKLHLFLKLGDHWITLNQALILQIILFITSVIIGSRAHYFKEQLKLWVVFFMIFEAFFFAIGFIQIKIREAKLMKDLFNLQDTLRYQAGSGVEVNDVLLSVYPNIKDKSLKGALNKLILAYSHGQYVLDKIDAIKEVGKNNNLHAFSNILKQKYSIGDISESVETEAQVLADFDTNRKIARRRTKHIELIVLTFVLAVQLSILLVVPNALRVVEDFYRIMR